MTDILDSIAAQIVKSETNIKSIMKQLEQDVVKQMAKEQLTEKLLTIIQQTQSGDKLSVESSEQLQQAESYKHSNCGQLTQAKVLLAMLLLQKLQYKFSSEQKHDMLLFLYTNHMNGALHLHVLQLVVRGLTEEQLSQNVYILLQYFAMASQQMNQSYLCLFNAVQQHFINQNNYYAAYEFFKRNQGKAASVLKNFNGPSGGTEQDINDFYYKASLVTAASGQYQAAASLLKRCDSRTEQRLQLLGLLLQILTLQDFEFADTGIELYNKIQLYYLNGQVRYFKRCAIDYVSLEDIQRALDAEDARKLLRDHRVLFLARTIASQVFAARLHTRYLQHIYSSSKVTQDDFPGIDLRDLNVKNGIVMFQSNVGLYQTSKPRRMLIDQLSRRLEQQKMTALRNVRPEEVLEEPEKDNDDDKLFDDFFDFYDASE